MKKDHLTLTENDRTTLEGLLAKGTLAVKTFKRATALLELDRGKTLRAVAETLDVTYTTVAAWRNGYRTKGLDCLYDAPRSGRRLSLMALSAPKSRHWRVAMHQKAMTAGPCASWLRKSSKLASVRRSRILWLAQF
jgi:transposase